MSLSRLDSNSDFEESNSLFIFSRSLEMLSLLLVKVFLWTISDSFSSVRSFICYSNSSTLEVSICGTREFCYSCSFNFLMSYLSSDTSSSLDLR